MALLFPQHTLLELTKTSFVSSCQNSSIAVYSARSIGGRPCATIYNCPFRRLALGAARPRRRGDRMKRRDFITLVGGAAVAWPIAAPAQQAPRPVIGLLGSGTAAAQSEWTAALLQRLRELGWSEGGHLTIEYRWGEGRTERFSEIAAEFVQRKVTIILTHNTPPTLAAMGATSSIPIVFATAGEPIGAGIVASLARP